MTPHALLTTSWDDGHPLDLRLADLLAKYGIAGTFYVPRASSERRTMNLAELRMLARDFELGGHTINHVVLTTLRDDLAWEEIAGVKAWLEQDVGVPCRLFCPPQGRYACRHVNMIRRAGYVGLRSAELGSFDFPRRENGFLLMPTTVQAYPHGRVLDLLRNGIKRAAVGNLWRFLVHGRSADWSAMATSMLRHALERGGVFHLWGHSWELSEPDHWQRLERVLRLMAEMKAHAPVVTNGEVCRYAADATDGGRPAAAPARPARTA